MATICRMNWNEASLEADRTIRKLLKYLGKKQSEIRSTVVAEGVKSSRLS